MQEGYNQENMKWQKKNKQKSNLNFVTQNNTYKGITPIIAIDCEMVLCKNSNPNIRDKANFYIHEVARVSITNYNGHVLYDEYIRPKKQIVNYLT